MKFLENYISNISETALRKKILEQLDRSCVNLEKHGNFDKWNDVLTALSVGNRSFPTENNGYIVFRSGIHTEQNKELLKVLHPWRKGPYKIGNITIETEWRSDLKWDRLRSEICDLRGRNVLDVGSGNGYHAYRMILDGVKNVVCIDPYILSVMQFYAIAKFSLPLPIILLPLGIDEIESNWFSFDTVFSMGLLYHRRDMKEHLLKLKSLIKSGGELVLETLIYDVEEPVLFVPKGRYAKMRNVWGIPSVAFVNKLLVECGFGLVKLIDKCKTTTKEQCSTEWMQYESLTDFLDPTDENKTIEGEQAPIRAIFTARNL